MHFSTAVLSLAAVAELALANPVPGQYPTRSVYKRGTTFSVPQRKKALLPGPIAHRRTYLKYGVPAPDYVINAAEKASAELKKRQESGSVAADPEQNDSEYLEAVTVAGTKMTLDFDTGSSDLWVYSSLQDSSQTSSHAVFDTSAATPLSGSTWSISYGDGSTASGKVYTGTVEIGGVSATKQAIEAASEISQSFQQDTNNDGLVGLAFSSINQVKPTQQKTFFDNVKGQLASPLFTATLKKDQSGSYDFGKIDTSKASGSVSYVDVDSSQGFWGFTTSSYQVGTGSSASPSSGDSILDTGTSLWYMTSDAVAAYYKQVSSATNDQQNAGGWTFDCTETLPSMTVGIGDAKITVSGDLINYSDAGNGKCFGGIQEASGLPQMIFGDVFLKAVFAVFDSDGPKIGLAPQSGS